MSEVPTRGLFLISEVPLQSALEGGAGEESHVCGRVARVEALLHPEHFCTPLGPYRRPMPRVLRGSQGVRRRLQPRPTRS
jgi:hypothetical protein